MTHSRYNITLHPSSMVFTQKPIFLHFNVQSIAEERENTRCFETENTREQRALPPAP